MFSTHLGVGEGYTSALPQKVGVQYRFRLVGGYHLSNWRCWGGGGGL